MNIKETPIVMGTASGTFLSTFAVLRMEDIFLSALLAVIGAIISFLMSCILNLYLKPKLRYFKNKQKKNQNN